MFIHYVDRMFLFAEKMLDKKKAKDEAKK